MAAPTIRARYVVVWSPCVSVSLVYVLTLCMCVQAALLEDLRILISDRNSAVYHLPLLATGSPVLLGAVVEPPGGSFADGRRCLDAS